MDAILKFWRQIKNHTFIYAKNIPAKFHPDPIWNNRSLGFLKRSPNKKNNKKKNKMSSDMISVSTLKMP